MTAYAPVCLCPTCGVADKLLRVKLACHGFNTHELAARLEMRSCDFAGGSYPYLASVRVDGREVYRIMARPDEVFEADVLADIVAALRRSP